MSKPSTSQLEHDIHTSYRSVNVEDEDPLLDHAGSEHYKRDVEYDGDNHLAVLFQMHGSVWGHVLPWCILADAVTISMYYLRQYNVIDLTLTSSNAHTFMSILVSFLVVTRATITYNRFMEARQYLADLYRTGREIVQYTCLLSTARSNTNAAAQQWRQDVAYHTIVTLRLCMAALEFQSRGVIVTLDELSDTDGQPTHDLAHGPRTRTDQAFGAPMVWAYSLRETIISTQLETPLHVNEELKILSFSSELLHAFVGLKKLITTPFPFPLVQMTRTFLFVWVFTLPCVLLSSVDDDLVQVLVLMFFIAYGFLGLEYVNMELDDPYGTDPNDFPTQRWSEQVFQDIYWTILKTDGYDRAMELKSRITERMARGNALDNYRNEMTRNSFWHLAAKGTSSGNSNNNNNKAWK